MYIPTSFREDRLPVLHDFIREHSFATLVSQGDDGPFVSHLPMTLEEPRDESSNGVLVGHLARANPHVALLAAGAPTVAIFHGPHAYVSPNW